MIGTLLRKVVRLRPFRFASKPHARIHGPTGYTSYRKMKPWLRDEFAFRCVYCLERERWYPTRHRAFSADHVRPQMAAPHLVCNYDNLVYACLLCNSAKQNLILPDPTKERFDTHLSLGRHGEFKAHTKQGEILIKVLHLNSEERVETRQRMLSCIAMQKDVPRHPSITRMFEDFFGYPTDLPNLERCKPPGNTRPGGVRRCHYTRRNQLAAFY